MVDVESGNGESGHSDRQDERDDGHGLVFRVANNELRIDSMNQFQP
jgi:hypothetical protein